MSKTHKPTAAFKMSRKNRELAERTMRRTAHIGFDPRNSHATDAAVVYRMFPETHVVNGKRVWKV